MKRPRAVTPDEIREWREANKYTAAWADLSDAQVEEEVRSSALPEEELRGPMPSPRPSRGGRGGKAELSPLKQLSIREASRSFKQYSAVEATLDLHGMTKLEAYDAVQRFIQRMHREGTRHITIITGKGRAGQVGVLRSHLPHWLNEPSLRPLISAVAEARAEKGGAGVLHVLVKKPS